MRRVSAVWRPEGAPVVTGSPVEGVRLVVLRGPTGAGKTSLLAALARRGEQVVDLEALAGHSGSAFGGIGRPPQPARAAFRSTLHDVVTALPRDRPVWIEQEGPFLGSLSLPRWLQAAVAVAPAVEMRAPVAARIRRIVDTYGRLDPELMAEATERIRPRLGDGRADEACAAFRAGRTWDAVATLLPYFDAAYDHRHRTSAVRGPGWGVLDLAVLTLEDAARTAPRLVCRTRCR